MSTFTIPDEFAGTRLYSGGREYEFAGTELECAEEADAKRVRIFAVEHPEYGIAEDGEVIEYTEAPEADAPSGEIAAEPEAEDAAEADDEPEGEKPEDEDAEADDSEEAGEDAGEDAPSDEGEADGEADDAEADE